MQPIQQNAYTHKVMKYVPLFMISSVCVFVCVCVQVGACSEQIHKRAKNGYQQRLFLQPEVCVNLL